MKKTTLLLLAAMVMSGCAQPMIQAQNECRIEAANLYHMKRAHDTTAKSDTHKKYIESLIAVNRQAEKVRKICGGAK